MKKAKLEIRLGRLKLDHAIPACEQDDHPHCQESLSAFLTLMQGSWKTLEAAGRRAEKHPDGYKELDIALREGSRLLEDLKHRLPYQDQDQISRVQKEADQLRGAVLKALFPSLGSPQSEAGKPPRNLRFGPAGVSI